MVSSVQESESLQQEQWLLWRVSEVLHFVSHAMHAISDIMVDLRRAPPRQLRARPIIIQQPALVQVGIVPYDLLSLMSLILVPYPTLSSPPSPTPLLK